ncbi:hypothetical protein [Celerinatantimonas sp. YJH-8]|uniref:hypothetical protein n=1 Tax=Celerinatantimonas sp. YJH-8 TaxID=3228714 RepID=UPI0038CB16DC
MKNISEYLIKEPIFMMCRDFLFDSHGIFNEKYELINDDKFALDLFYSQNIPSKYIVWQDRIENEVAKFTFSKDYGKAEDYIDDAIKKRTSFHSKKNLEYRKKKLKNKNTKADDLYFEIIDDIYHQMKMLSIQRYIHGVVNNSLLEDIFQVIENGYLPCGMTSECNLCVYDFKFLMRE